MEFEVFKIGDLVTSEHNSYGGKISCEVDRVYKRSGSDYVRLKFNLNGETKLINVPMYSCSTCLSFQRNEKLKKLGL